jgi:signal transduction histidine kinase
MHTEFLAGVVFAWVIAYIGIGVSFCVAYFIHRREPEHLLFGLHSLALAIYSIGLTLIYTQGSEAEARFATMIAVSGAILGNALILHFALLFAKVRRPLPIVRPVYVAALALELANAAGLLLRVSDPRPISVKLGPLTVDHLRVQASPLGALLCFGGIGASLFALALLLRAVLGGRRDGIIPVIGGACMTATTIHDALLALGLSGGTWLGPFGNSLFVFSITGAFLIRSSILSKELTDQSLELKRRSGELMVSYEELREAQRELMRKEQLAAVGELAAVIAHEVRNPLAIISNAVAGLRKAELAHDDRDTLLTILKEEASRLNRLVGDLLRFARPVNVQRQLISVRDVIERTLASSALRETIPVQVVEDGEVHGVWGDPGLLRQVFENLVDNAVQAMGGPTLDGSTPPTGRLSPRLTIVVRGGRRDSVEGVHVDVQDTGEGMDANVRLRAKDPFFTTRPSGTGLGLAIVDRIVEAHDGELSIASRPGQGTTISVFLPIGAPVPPSSGALLARGEELDPTENRPWTDRP